MVQNEKKEKGEEHKQEEMNDAWWGERGKSEIPICWQYLLLSPLNIKIRKDK